jgi:hypothetical protein
MKTLNHLYSHRRNVHQRRKGNHEESSIIGGITKEFLDCVIWLRGECNRNLLLITIFSTIFDNEGVRVRAMHQYHASQVKAT